MLILRILASGERHGYDISKRILLLSNSSLKVGHGSMYPALHRLEKKSLIKSRMGETEKGRSAKFYQLTRLGLNQVEIEKRQWKEFVSVIDSILERG